MLNVKPFLFEEETTGAVETAAETTKKGLSTGTIVGIIIAAVLVVVAVVLCIVFREKLKKLFKVYKSEVKKIVWLPWDQTRKSTAVVLVALIVCALVICLLDLALGRGILAVIGLFK